MGYEISFKEHQKQMVRAAEELKYSSEVVEKIRNAKTEYEITKILERARREGNYIKVYEEEE